MQFRPPILLSERIAETLPRQARRLGDGFCVRRAGAGRRDARNGLGTLRQRRLQPAEHRVRIVFEPAAVDRRQRRLYPAVRLGAGVRRQLPRQGTARCRVARPRKRCAITARRSGHRHQATLRPPWIAELCASARFLRRRLAAGRRMGGGGATARAVMGQRLGHGQPAALVRYRRRHGGRAVGGAQRADLVAEPGRVFLCPPQRPGLSRVATGGGQRSRARPRGGRQARRTRSPHGAARRNAGQHRRWSRRRARTGARSAGRVLALGHCSRHRRHHPDPAALAVAAPRRPSARSVPPARRRASPAPPSRASGSAWWCRSIRRRFCSPPG